MKKPSKCVYAGIIHTNIRSNISQAELRASKDPEHFRLSLLSIFEMSDHDLFFFNKLLLVDDYATFHTRIRNRAFDITSVEFNIKQAAVSFIHLANTFALRVIKKQYTHVYESNSDNIASVTSKLVH